MCTVYLYLFLFSLSENVSQTRLPASSNPYLCLAIVLSMSLHFAILHVPFLANIFSVVPLNQEEWKQVLHISVPISIIDEILKYITRTYISPPVEQEKLEDVIIWDFSKKEKKE